jgi:hypothetical protein
VKEGAEDAIFTTISGQKFDIWSELAARLLPHLDYIIIVVRWIAWYKSPDINGYSEIVQCSFELEPGCVLGERREHH